MTFGRRIERRLFALATCCVALLTLAGHYATAAQTQSLLELTLKDGKIQGKLEAKAAGACWLMGRDGKLSLLPLNRITSVRTVAPRFREFSAAELRDHLRREMPKPMRIEGTGRFLVCAEKNNRRYAELCEETYRTFHRYFSVRGFKISEPEFPLVAIVFPERSGFVEYCRSDGIEPPSGMLGYYMRLTNRVALFDPGTSGPAAEPHRAGGAALPTYAGAFERSTRRSALPWDSDFFDRADVAGSRLALPYDAVVEANLQNTIVHETTHQVAFNTGLHSRIGPTPKWVIEGLATMFEAPGIRDAQKNSSPKSRINRDRFVWFGNYAAKRRPPGSLAAFVSSDELYASDALDAYAQGWALTFFLAETRHGSYVRYLKSIAKRNPMKNYSADERLADFRGAFGDVRSIETDFLRFFEKIAKQ